MAEYIEREAAIEFVEEQMKEINNKTCRMGSYVTETYDMAIRHAVSFLRYVPTACPKANTVEVVRCKDCEFLKILNNNDLYAFCLKTEYKFLPFQTDTRTHFCSYGKRKGD